MLTVRTLSVRFRTPVLSGISFDLPAGHILAVIGASGAGKSVLAHAILGLLPANATTQGQILLNAAPILPAHRGKHIALLPQQITHLDPTARVATQLRWAARRTGKAPNTATLTQAELRLTPPQLSGGMARRVLLALAEAGNPPLLIADEPTSGLDPANRDLVLTRLRQRADAGGAVLLITHDLAAALPHADHVAILSDGTLHETAPAAAFTAQGDTLPPMAKALWRALPQNGFHHA